MKRVEALCPSCGAPVEFKVSSSLVVVCAHCNSAVARGDRQLEDLGKVAALVETASPLDLGVNGVYRGKSFELVGHVQYRHASGAVWDEWYLSFANGNWGWLAEAQGRFYVTARRQVKDPARLPAFETLTPGRSLTFADEPPLTVNETGEAQLVAAEGELPFRPDPAMPHRYADLSGENQRFATLDFSEQPPVLFLGDAVTLAQVGISPRVEDDERRVHTVASLVVACPHCGGSLDLRAPDRTERVVCPYCHSQLDASQGELRYLKTLQKGRVHPLIPLGRTGKFRGESYTVIGFLQRSVTILRQDYFWTEYLLYHERDGFRWLVDSSGHWSFVEPVAPGEIKWEQGRAVYRGRRFRLYQRCPARVRYVLGEFFWKVEEGETVLVSDYIAPPHMLSSEVTYTKGKKTAGAGGEAQEINVSHGVYVPREEIEAAFGVTGLPRAWSVAAHQPNPVEGRVYGLWLGFLLVMLLGHGLLVLIRPSGTVDQAWLVWQLILLTAVPFLAFFYGRSFEVKRWEDSHIE